MRPNRNRRLRRLLRAGRIDRSLSALGQAGCGCDDVPRRAGQLSGLKNSASRSEGELQNRRHNPLDCRWDAVRREGLPLPDSSTRPSPALIPPQAAERNPVDHPALGLGDFRPSPSCGVETAIRNMHATRRVSCTVRLTSRNETTGREITRSVGFAPGPGEQEGRNCDKWKNDEGFWNIAAKHRARSSVGGWLPYRV